VRPTWAEIDLDAFEGNVAAVRSILPEGARLVAVLKADAYGHGAVELARRCGADVAMIATALLEEALELRGAGVTTPILVLGPVTARQIAMALENQITLGVPGPEELAAVVEAARDRDIAIHLKLDSGMGRMGVLEAELAEVAAAIRAAPRLTVEGLYTHFANADVDSDPFTDVQIANYDRMLRELHDAGIDAPLHHFANSAATLRHRVRPGDWARVGIALYGAAPAVLENGRALRPVMTWRTEIARLKTIPPGHAVGYGTTFHTARASRIATLPVGYADGYDRLLSNRGEVLVRGHRAPVVGRVSMDLVTVDVTEIDGVGAGDEVILLGAQGAGRITADEIAARVGTISYEVFCNVSARVPRIYRDEEGLKLRSRFSE
jgi:alanine racemase